VAHDWVNRSPRAPERGCRHRSGGFTSRSLAPLGGRRRIDRVVQQQRVLAAATPDLALRSRCVVRNRRPHCGRLEGAGTSWSRLRGGSRRHRVDRGCHPAMADRRRSRPRSARCRREPPCAKADAGEPGAAAIQRRRARLSPAAWIRRSTARHRAGARRWGIPQTASAHSLPEPITVEIEDEAVPVEKVATDGSRTRWSSAPIRERSLPQRVVAVRLTSRGNDSTRVVRFAVRR